MKKRKLVSLLLSGALVFGLLAGSLRTAALPAPRLLPAALLR